MTTIYLYGTLPSLALRKHAGKVCISLLDCLLNYSCQRLSGGIYSLRLTFCDRYPEKPPKVRFTTKMFHPNVYADGNICLDIIAAKWTPSYTVSSILTSIQSLLTDPNVQSPANPVRGTCFALFVTADCFFSGSCWAVCQRQKIVWKAGAANCGRIPCIVLMMNCQT